jgi:hypothetical protein
VEQVKLPLRNRASKLRSREEPMGLESQQATFSVAFWQAAENSPGSEIGSSVTR